MFTKRLSLLVTLLLILFVNNAQAQNESATKATQASKPAVTASISTGGAVRIASTGQVMQIRLEIYAASGEMVFDSGLRQGNVIDWKVADATQAMTDGSYLVVVTTKDFQGKLSQRLGGVTLQSGQPTLKQQRQEEMTAAQTQTLSARRQSQKIEAADDLDSLTVLRAGKERSVVVTAHDGQDGQVTSTNGSLTLRTGDVFSGGEKEQVRITPEGRVGVGTDKPEATLDVAGTIRARGGIQFEDGTVLNSAAGVNAPQPGIVVSNNTQNGSTTASAIGTGTQNKLPKWSETGGNGTLVDSLITETPSGFIGINNPNPTSRLQVSASAGAEMRFDQGSLGITPVLSIVSQPSSTTQGGAAILGAGTGGSSFVFTDNFPFHIVKDTKANVINNNLGNGTPLFTMLPSGNVGIGNTNPSVKLEVTGGNLKLTSPGSGIVFSDGTTMTTAAAGGGQMTGDNIIAAINANTTTGTILDQRLVPNVARLSLANIWVAPNIFNSGISVNNVPISNVGNPVNAGDAVNKAYADANFVKFVPGAEQLSVGDANGTATMINLRGGSTCCSGPGGHTPAFFKVFQNGSFVATGNLGIGTSPMEGKGYRTSWHTYKGAFRSGYADNEWDDANVGFFSWAGGSNSTASGLYALAFGDTNFARSTSSIAFGSGNEVKGAAGFSAGAGNRVCDTYGVALGNNAKSGGPYIDGKCDPEIFNIRGLAAVAIGYNVTADQDHTMAFGKFASNNGFQGTFIWSDGAPQASADTFRNTANNEFAARATGGFRFRTNLGGTTGCNLPAGSGVFNCTSSRATKENFMLANGEDVLSRLRKIPVSTWNYIAEGKSVRHMGPMAEDFYQAFKLGTGNTSIGVQDLAGVSLAAIKALEQRTNELQQKTAEVEQLRTQVSELRSANNAMEQRLAALEQNAAKASKPQPKAQSRRRR